MRTISEEDIELIARVRKLTGLGPELLTDELILTMDAAGGINEMFGRTGPRRSVLAPLLALAG